MRVSTVLALLALSTVTAAPASAQHLVLKIAIDPSIGGTMHAAGTGTLRGTIVDVSEETWTETHSERSPLFEAGVDVPVGAPALQAVVAFEYGRAGATATSPGTLNGNSLKVSFDPYNFWGIEGGVRVGSEESVGVYGTATVGMRRVSAISGVFTTAMPVTIVMSEIYDASVVPTFGFGGGVMFGVIGVEAIVKHAGGLSAASTTDGTLPAQIATAGARWSLPISLVLRF
jgi:hypothetical protein